MRILPFVSIATTALWASIGSTHATVITLGSTQYDITSVRGAYNANTALLQSQPWWGDVNAASAAAEAIGSSSGENSPFGPAFAYEAVTGAFTTTVNTRVYYAIGSVGLDWQYAAESGDVAYAVATRVDATGVPDGGATGPLFALGLGGVALWRRRVPRS